MNIIHAHGGIDYRQALCGAVLRSRDFGPDLANYANVAHEAVDGPLRENVSCAICRALMLALAPFEQEAQRIVNGVLGGAYTLEALDQTWDATFAGNCRFAVRPTTVVWTVFNDCDSVDYSDSFTFDGSELRFGYFRDPLEALTPDEDARIKALIKAAPVASVQAESESQS